MQRISIENLCEKKEKFRSATGINPDCFICFFNYLNSGDDCSNIKFHDTSKCLTEERYTNSEEVRSGPKPKISAKEQLFMYLSWLKNRFILSHVSFLFQATKATVSRYIITWLNFLYFSLGSIPIWPTREQINEDMTEMFKRTYPSTWCILDCTEFYCQRATSLFTQSSLYSHYKSHVTYKSLIGESHSGSVTFFRELHDGSLSDKEVVRKCDLIEKKLWSPRDSVIADHGFTIESNLKELNINLNIAFFLGWRAQLTAAAVKESQTIASVRIHAECAIQRIKKFKVIRNEMPLILMVKQINYGRCVVYCVIF